jgi:hypothetical protein
MNRQFVELYRWEGGSWQKLLNIYDWAQAFFGSTSFGLVVDGRPQPGTAVLSTDIRRIEASGKLGNIGDVLVLSLKYFLGPTGIQHPGLTVAVLAWDGHDIVNVWKGDFAVRGQLVSTRMGERGLELIVDAYLPDDPMCCPRGWEQLLLMPSSFSPRLLDVAKRCVAPQYSDCLHQT